MANLTTSYLGLTLPNPVVAGSSGLTGNIASLKRLSESGIGAVVLKSLFEEQILQHIRMETAKGGVIYGYAEIDDYIAHFERKHEIGKYLRLVKEAKEELGFPVIASINCISSSEWQDIAGEVANAGADALQLNAFVPVYDATKAASDVEDEYIEIVKKVTAAVGIPVTVKIGFHFTNIPDMARRIVEAGASGLVLFNRYYSTDFDIDLLKPKNGAYFSSPGEYSRTLRWISLLYGELKTSLTAATGVHDGDTLIKMILAGADAVEVVSALYKSSPAVIGEMTSRLSGWMDEKGYATLEDFRGFMSRNSSKVPAEYERVQYMQSYGDLQG
jgi:dihydroorotate dehydrogenase (fumarate)